MVLLPDGLLLVVLPPEALLLADLLLVVSSWVLPVSGGFWEDSASLDGFDDDSSDSRLDTDSVEAIEDSLEVSEGALAPLQAVKTVMHKSTLSIMHIFFISKTPCKMCLENRASYIARLLKTIVEHPENENKDNDRQNMYTA